MLAGFDPTGNTEDDNDGMDVPLDAFAAYPSSDENDSVQPNDEEMPNANSNSDSGQEEQPSNAKPKPKKQLLFRNFTEKANEFYKACSNDSKM